MRFTTRETGATLVEVLVAIALAGIVLPVLAEAILTSNAARPTAERRLAAIGLEREALEAVRIAREADWSTVATAGTYHPVRSGDTWTLASGSESTNGFTRQITITDVERNSSGAIVASSGALDPSTKHVTVTISWIKPYASSVTSGTYLTRWQHSTGWAQTSQADFSSGTLADTDIVASGDGAVELTSPAISGTYESTTFDAGGPASFNALIFSATQPVGSEVKLQIATSAVASPAGWDYVGPDGTAGSYYTSGGAIPLANGDTQYVRFKAYLSTSGSTPTLDDVTVGYSL
jgi:type II secretory pathway pseudopilin PulG